MLTIVPASPHHVGIASRLREIDKLECAAFGRTPKQALRLSLASSEMAWTARLDGRAEAMFGVSAVSVLDGIGSPWLLLTDVGARQARALVEQGREFVKLMQRRFATLENRVHADNAVAIRWLERLHFTIGDVSVMNGHRMRSFVRHREP